MTADLRANAEKLLAAIEAKDEANIHGWGIALARAALEAELPATGLDAAWAEAEAALPEGWGLVLSSRDGMHDAYATDPVMSSAWEVAASGPTPTAALQALTARLREAQ